MGLLWCVAGRALNRARGLRTLQSSEAQRAFISRVGLIARAFGLNGIAFSSPAWLASKTCVAELSVCVSVSVKDTSQRGSRADPYAACGRIRGSSAPRRLRARRHAPAA